MNLLYFILGPLVILEGRKFIRKGKKENKFYKKLENGEFLEYNKVLGIVTGNATYHEDAFSNGALKPGGSPVTPIVEYEVNGEKYETINNGLSTGADLPMGTKMWVWYDKNNPKIAHLEFDRSSSSTRYILGTILILVGIVIFLSAFFLSDF